MFYSVLQRVNLQCKQHTCIRILPKASALTDCTAFAFKEEIWYTIDTLQAAFLPSSTRLTRNTLFLKMRPSLQLALMSPVLMSLAT